MSITDEHKQYRERLWESVLGPYMEKDHLDNKEKRLFRYIEKLYFGESLDPDEPNIQKYIKSHGGPILTLFLQDQNPDVWRSNITDAAPKWGYTKWRDVVHRFGRMEQSHFAPMAIGWDSDSDWAHFCFWWGDRYDPDTFELQGNTYPHPYSAEEVCDKVGWGIFSTLSGRSHYECRYHRAYDYWKSAVLAMDERILLPESGVGDDAFEGLGRHEIHDKRDAKQTVAYLLGLIHQPEKWMQEYDDEKTKKNGFGLPKTPFGMEDIDSGDLWNLPNLVAIRENFMNDLESGVLPESIKPLSRWAESPNSNFNSLYYSTGNDRESYEDPWSVKKPAKRSSKKKASRASNKPVPTITDEAFDTIKPRLNAYRDALNEVGVPVSINSLEEVSDLATLLLQTTPAKNLSAEASELATSGLHFDYLELLIPEYRFEIWREPFAAFDESEVGPVFRNIWKHVERTTKAHCTIESIRTRKKEIEDGEYDVAVKVKTAKHDFGFNYSVNNSELDREIYTDISHFNKTMELPWQFLFDTETSESEVFVYYLPEAARSLVISGLEH